MKCDYCQKMAEKTTGKEVYPHRKDLWHKAYYICKDCDARVGCHENGEPFGRLANKELRVLKMQAHKAFDPLWREGSLSRSQAYFWLAKKLLIPIEKTHIGMFDEEFCLKTIEVCKGYTGGK